MSKLNIICIDDQRDVLAALRKDLEEIRGIAEIVACESADEAMDVLENVARHGEEAALLICDHVMPGTNGVDFLARISGDLRFTRTKKILLTGLASHQDTIAAINRARIDYYIEKPWTREGLIAVVKRFLTQYVIEAGLDYTAYASVMDQDTLYRELHLKNR